MNKTKIISLHALCWMIILIYTYGGFFLKKIAFMGAAFGFSITIVQMIQFYICFLWVYPTFMRSKKLIHLVSGLIIALFSFIFLRYLIEEVLYFYMFNINNYGSHVTIRYYIMDNIYYGTSFIFISAGVFSIQQNFKSEIATNKLKGEVVRAELAFLKSQVNPHFLYNTLNYIYSLAIPASEKLADAVLRLSELMRYILDESTDGKVQLKKEVQYLESYISLFKMRFEPDFYIDFKMEGVREEHEVAALVLIPFVENAFKHGVVNDPSHPVKMVLTVEKQKLFFEVSNKVSSTQKDTTSGVGLVNVRRRLALIYPDQHELLISNHGSLYRSTLIIYLKS